MAESKAEGGTPRTQWVDLEVNEGIATITINRPEAMNALNEEVIGNLGEVFAQAEADPNVTGIILAGAGKAFVAGADIAFFIKRIKEGDFKRIENFARMGQAVFRKIEKSAKPVVAVADGLALGGGSELALSCTAIVATEKSRFAFPETSIGIYPGLGGTQRSGRVVGKALARYMVLSGAALSGQEALETGFAGYYADSEKALEFARELLKKGGIKDKFAAKDLPEAWKKVAFAFEGDGVTLADGADMGDERVARAAKALSRNAPLALAASARYISEGLKLDLDAGLELELAEMAAAFEAKDALEGLTALGVRKPEWKGE